MTTPTLPPGPSSSRVLFPRPTGDTILTAAIAVGALLLVKFAVAFVQLIGNAVDYDPSFYSNGFLSSPIGLFVGSLVLYPFPFYLAAFVSLAALFPILRESTLSTILRRAVAAGVVATIVLALVGIAPGVINAASSGDAVVVVLWVVFIPLAAGVQLTAVLVGGAVVSWVWLSRQPGAADPALDDRGRQDATSEPSDEANAPQSPVAPALTEHAGPSAPEAPAAPEQPAAPAKPPISIYAPPSDRP